MFPFALKSVFPVGILRLVDTYNPRKQVTTRKYVEVETEFVAVTEYLYILRMRHIFGSRGINDKFDNEGFVLGRVGTPSGGTAKRKRYVIKSPAEIH